MSNCSSVHRVQKVWGWRCCYFQHGQTFLKFFTGSMSKRDLVHLLPFRHPHMENDRMKCWKTNKQAWKCHNGRGKSGITLLNASYKRDELRVSLMAPGKTWQLGHLGFTERHWTRWSSQAPDANYGNRCLSRKRPEPRSLMLIKVLIVSGKAFAIDTAGFRGDWLPVP